MPINGDRPVLLIDTSVAVAIAVADHEHHLAAMDATHGRALGLAGHACFETYSVLTRLPPPDRRAPHDVSRLLARNFPESRFLDSSAQAGLALEIAELRIAGGAVYDALVAGAARHHGLPLLTRDGRAIDVYRRFDLELEVLR